MDAPAEVTVVIATRNRVDELCHTLAQLTALPERPPVTVVDNDSSDGSAAAVRRRFPEVTVVALPANMGAAARTVGARWARTPFVAFSDDDSWWEPGALVAATAWLRADPRIGLVAGHVLVGPTATNDPTSQAMAGGPLDEWLRPSPSGARGVTGFLACAAVVRRAAFLAGGGFDPHLFIGGEEELVALNLAQAGWKLVYAPGVIAHHHPSPARNPVARRRTLLRNDLLTAWVRYSSPTAWRRTMGALAPVVYQRATWSALAAASRSAAWAAARRDVVDRQIERAFTR